MKDSHWQENVSEYICIVLVIYYALTLSGCAETGFSQASSGAALSSVESEAGGQIVQPEETGSAPAPLCLNKGERVDTAHINGNVYIYYRKCDAEIELWKQMYKDKCCSRKVAIIDHGVNADPQCPDGRFYGIAVCE